MDIETLFMGNPVRFYRFFDPCTEKSGLEQESEMEQVAYVIKKMNLHVLSIDDVPESFSSAVYRLELSNQETVFLKIPYSKEKLIREAEALEALKGTVPVPNVLDCWGEMRKSQAPCCCLAYKDSPSLKRWINN